MSMMVNPAGHNQIIAAGEPFKLRMPRKKKPAEPPEDTSERQRADADTDPEADADTDE